MNNTQPKIFRVTEITRLIKSVLEEEIGEVWIEGELSNVRRPSSGHCYFTIKDKNAQISAVMFRGHQKGLRFLPENGLAVRVFGQISLYEKSGQYQIIVYKMEQGGLGALQAAFEVLKKKLFEEGLFDHARKKNIPMLPRHIGVVTSPTGAAIRDILNVLSRRFSNLHIVLAPVRVQGSGAADEIAEAINTLNDMGIFDVLIIGRGGGSLEDLWCFNEEVVARAIARSTVPVISAVGHEIDFTISDFTADLRASTPSAAAELAIGNKADFEADLDAFSQRLGSALQQQWLNIRNRFLAASNSYVFQEPRHLVQRVSEQIERLNVQMEHSIRNTMRERHQRVDESNFRMTRQMQEWKRVKKLTIQRLEALLNGMNPLAVLDRGYSITCQGNGRILKSVDNIREREHVHTRLANGMFESEVITKSDRKNHKTKTRF